MENEKNLTAAVPFNVAIYEGGDTGLEEIESGDLIIPRLNISQPTTPDIEQDKVGKFLINVTGDDYDTMNVAIVKLTKSRILFPEKYKRDNEPLCRSHDFKTPADDIEGATPMDKTCELIPGDKKNHVCPYANWGSDNTPPRCQETWNFLLVDLDSYIPMWFSVKSTALKPMRKIVSAISMICKAKRLPMWAMSFNINIEKIVNDSGTFYVPKCTKPEILSEDEIVNMTDIRTDLLDVDIKDAVEADKQAPPASGSGEEMDDATF